MRLPSMAKAEDLPLQQVVDSARPRSTICAWICGFLLLIALLQLALWPAVIAAKGGLGPYVRITTDYLPTLMGAQIIRDGNGQHLYDRETQREALRRIVAPYLTPSGSAMNIYNHPPAEALLAAALFDLPAEVLFWIWTALAMLAFGLSLWILAMASPLRRPILWLGVAAACSYHPVHLSWWLGQNTAFVLLGLSCLYAGLHRRQHWLAAFGLALLILKPQLLPAIGLVLLLERHWRTIVSAIAMLVGLSSAAMPILGMMWPLHYARFLLIDSNQGDVVSEKPMIMHNWRGFAVNLFDRHESPFVAPTFIALSVASLGLLLFAWWFARRSVWTLQQAQGDERRDLLFALTCISALLISVHLNPHDLALLIVPMWIVGGYLTTARWPIPLARLWNGIIWVCYSLPFLTYYIAATDRVPVITSVALMAFATVVLTWQISKLADAQGARSESFGLSTERGGQLVPGVRPKL